MEKIIGEIMLTCGALVLLYLICYLIANTALPTVWPDESTSTSREKKKNLAILAVIIEVVLITVSTIIQLCL